MAIFASDPSVFSAVAHSATFMIETEVMFLKGIFLHFKNIL